MKTNNDIQLCCAVLVALFWLQQAALSADSNWIQGGEGDWNEDSNWLDALGDNFAPDSTLEDSPLIDNGGTAILEETAVTSDPPFPSVTVSNGGLQVRADGLLRSNALAVGDSGRLLLGGNGTLTISGSATSTGLTRIEGPGATFMVEDDFDLGGTLEAQITGANHSTITVGGSANLSGTLRPEFDGVSPTMGDSWSLINAGSVSGQLAMDPSLLPALENGVIFATAIDQNAGDVDLVVTNTLELVINRRSGAARIRNVVGDPIAIDDYTISSPSGLLNGADGAWQSLADSGGLGGNWTEGATSANSITESKTGDPASIAVGAPVEIGAPVSPANFAPEDATFRFAAEGRSLPGLVSYEGVPFNLVLNVDPVTGAAEISNQATIPIEFDGYAIQSASGALTVGSWSSLMDSGDGGAGWEEANPSANALSELNPSNTTTLAPNDSVSLGTVFDTAQEADLTFHFFLAGGDPPLRSGFVGYGGDPLDCSGDQAVDIADLDCGNAAGITNDLLNQLKLLPGDLDGVGGVAFADFLILSANFGTDKSKYTEGDIDGTGGVAFADFLILSGNFGQTANQAAAVPEPPGGILLTLSTLALLFARSKKYRR